MARKFLEKKVSVTTLSEISSIDSFALENRTNPKQKGDEFVQHRQSDLFLFLCSACIDELIQVNLVQEKAKKFLNSDCIPSINKNLFRNDTQIDSAMFVALLAERDFAT